MLISRDELVERITQAVPTDGVAEPVDGLRLGRVSAPTEPDHTTSNPSFCVVAQGSKEVRLGERSYRYDPEHNLIASNALPIAIRIAEATHERPYLGLVLRLEPSLVRSMMAELGPPAPKGPSAVSAIDVSPLDAELLDAILRLVRLADSPADARVLAPIFSGRSSTGS